MATLDSAASLQRVGYREASHYIIRKKLCTLHLMIEGNPLHNLHKNSHL